MDDGFVVIAMHPSKQRALEVLASLENFELECEAVNAAREAAGYLNVEEPEPEPPRMVRKTYETPAMPTMTNEQSAAWNGWFEAAFYHHTNDLMRLLGEEVGLIEKRIRADYEQKLGALRADLETYRAASSGLKLAKSKDTDAA